MMKTFKLFCIFGTRPEAVKMALLAKGLQSISSVECKVCVTAQHREMLDQVLDLFEISPDYDLDIMTPNQDLFDVTCNVLQGLKPVLTKEQPDMVLVHGDTTTTMAAALAAYYLKIPVGHIEAGLRTGNKFAPFPEEINRKVAGTVMDIHFAPTEVAKRNLLREGVDEANIFVTGDTVIDSLFSVTDKIHRDKALRAKLDYRFQFLDREKKLILVTGHRRENFGLALESICHAIAEIALSNPDAEILYPVHLNPKVKEPVMRYLGGGQTANVHLIEPVEYLPFVYLIERSHLIITDSGGIQVEAPTLGKPVLVMRDTTERPEAVAAGGVKLVGADFKTIVREANLLLSNPEVYERFRLTYNPYGDGRAVERIINILSQRINPKMSADSITPISYPCVSAWI